MRRERMVSVICELCFEGSLGAFFSGLEHRHSRHCGVTCRVETSTPRLSSLTIMFWRALSIVGSAMKESSRLARLDVGIDLHVTADLPDARRPSDHSTCRRTPFHVMTWWNRTGQTKTVPLVKRACRIDLQNRKAQSHLR